MVVTPQLDGRRCYQNQSGFKQYAVCRYAVSYNP